MIYSPRGRNVSHSLCNSLKFKITRRDTDTEYSALSSLIMISSPFLGVFRHLTLKSQCLSVNTSPFTAVRHISASAAFLLTKLTDDGESRKLSQLCFTWSCSFEGLTRCSAGESACSSCLSLRFSLRVVALNSLPPCFCPVMNWWPVQGVL